MSWINSVICAEKQIKRINNMYWLIVISHRGLLEKMAGGISSGTVYIKIYLSTWRLPGILHTIEGRVYLPNCIWKYFQPRADATKSPPSPRRNTCSIFTSKLMPVSPQEVLLTRTIISNTPCTYFDVYKNDKNMYSVLCKSALLAICTVDYVTIFSSPLDPRDASSLYNWLI